MDEFQIIPASNQKEIVHLQTLINIYKEPLHELEVQVLRTDDPSPAIVKAIRFLSGQIEVWQDAADAGNRVDVVEAHGLVDLDHINDFVRDFIVSRGLQGERGNTLRKAKDHTLFLTEATEFLGSFGYKINQLQLVDVPVEEIQASEDSQELVSRHPALNSKDAMAMSAKHGGTG